MLIDINTGLGPRVCLSFGMGTSMHLVAENGVGAHLGLSVDVNISLVIGVLVKSWSGCECRQLCK